MYIYFGGILLGSNMLASTLTVDKRYSADTR